MFEYKDRYLGIMSIVCGIAGYTAANKWRVLMSADPIGPSGIPKILSVGFIILGIILVLGSISSYAKNDETTHLSWQNFVLTVTLSLVCFVYLIILPYIGYLLATPLLLAIIMFTVGDVPLRTNLLVSIFTTVVLFVVFYSLLKVNLPLGFTKNFVANLPLRF